MAIIQISKLQARSGNLVDLPQLDEAEFAWASDDKKLFIGKTTPNENIEVLTSYSNISYSQITGSVGNLNINPVTVANGQPLVYNGTDWVNRGGNAGGLITLGNVSNVKITGGAIGYVLETDGLGNLAWTPKGSLYSNIAGLSNANPIVMTVSNTTPLTNDLQVTISGVNGASNNIINGQSFYIRLANDYPTSGNVKLYTGAGEIGPVDGAGLTYTNSPNAIATAVLAGGGSGAAQGANTSIQYNNSGGFDGGADLTWDFGAGKVLTVNGNANVGNLNATGVSTATRFISNVTTGTTPIQVVSTTRVGNLNVSYANVADYEVVTAQTTGTFYPVFVSGNTTANYALGSNANVTLNVATGALSATLLTGTLTTITQPNITSVGTLTTLSVNGTVTAVNVTANTGIFTGNGSGLSSVPGANVTGTVPLSTSATTAGTVTTAAQPNITSVGNLISLNTGFIYIGSGTPIPSTTATIQSGSDIYLLGSSAQSIVYDGYYSGTGGANWKYATTGQYVGAIRFDGIVGKMQIWTSASTGTAGANADIGPKVTVDNNGNVGIGTTSPSAKLDVRGNIDAASSSTSHVRIAMSGGVGSITSENAGTQYEELRQTGQFVSFYTGQFSASERMRIDSSGNVGIGNGAPSDKLSVNGTVYISGNTNVGNLITTVITAGANTTAGTITGNWGLSTGSKLTATYADLAEYYTADDNYQPGTVLAFGGNEEVTLASNETNKVAGVVTTNPAFIMNEACKDPAVAIALQGRVPCKVTGTIHKGDMMVSAGNGYAKASASPAIGTVIGKSLENFDGIDGIIEVAIGKT